MADVMDRQKKETSAIMNHLYVVELRVDVTVAEVDWRYKEIAAILNHVKGFTQVLDRNSFQLGTRKREKSAIQGNGKTEASSNEIG